MLQSMGSQRAGHDLTTEPHQYDIFMLTCFMLSPQRRLCKGQSSVLFHSQLFPQRQHPSRCSMNTGGMKM